MAERKPFFNEAQVARFLNNLAPLLSSIRTQFFLLWSTMISQLVSKNGYYVNSGIHFMLLDVIQRIKPALLIFSSFISSVILLLIKLQPFINTYLSKCALAKQIACCSVYKQYDLYIPHMFSTVVESLSKADLKNPKLFWYYTTGNPIPNDLFFSALNVLNYAYSNGSGLKPLESITREILIDMICDPIRINSLSTEELLEVTEHFDCMQVIGKEAYSKIIALLITTLYKRGALKNAHRLKFAKVLVKYYKDLKEAAKSIFDEAKFEVAMLFYSQMRKEDGKDRCEFLMTYIPAVWELLALEEKGEIYEDVLLEMILCLCQSAKDYKPVFNELPGEAEKKILYQFYCSVFAIKALEDRKTKNKEQINKLSIEIKHMLEESLNTSWKIACDELCSSVSKYMLLISYIPLNASTYLPLPPPEDKTLEKPDEVKRGYTLLGQDRIHLSDNEYSEIMKATNQASESLQTLLNEKIKQYIAKNATLIETHIDNLCVLYLGMMEHGKDTQEAKEDKLFELLHKCASLGKLQGMNKSNEFGRLLRYCPKAYDRLVELQARVSTKNAELLSTLLKTENCLTISLAL
eukprot:TRINITY_DN6482_c0_g8_i2.p1 TRINITY_DN6482_c0_g8~~TRINITY_DN6482_c0_g8_i2.p1  ORF type:complete len:670 (-),score=93.46 TRINITY_DN6482_c0_g8_i2:117-1850(-)